MIKSILNIICFFSVSISAFPSVSVVSASVNDNDSSCGNPDLQCKCFPGDSCWPSSEDWIQFNATVGGRLVTTVPLGSVCHKSNFQAYDATACETLKSVWSVPETHYKTSSSPMARWWANDSCNPFTAPSASCGKSPFIEYAVQAANIEDYKATIEFAKQRNIRLVIRNTGHDYFGRSTGAGALGLWTHHLKDIQVIAAYKSSSTYKGSALKMAAGVQAFEAYAAADAAGLAVVGGACDTVGLVGGFTQGGGIGPLASIAGLGADQVLEWEVVTATGDVVIATPDQHSQLYWALSGGGASTYGAVVSMTVRARPNMKVASASLSFSTNTDNAKFDEIMSKFLSLTPKLTDAGTWSSFYIIGNMFQLVPIFGPNLTVPQLQALLDPFLDELKSSGIKHEFNIRGFDTFKSAYDAMIGHTNISDANFGGRLIPRSVLEAPSQVSALMNTFRAIANAGGVSSGVVSSQSSKPFPDGISNAVNPAFRTSVMNVVFGLFSNLTDYSANIQMQETVTKDLMPKLVQLSPGGGSYVNEADTNEPDWQQAFYGDNYDKLLKVKDTYDPTGLFYGRKLVGSERWEYRVHTDGRLCRI